MARTNDTSEKESAKRRTILEAARGLLVERGFQDVALDDVAKRAGVAKGTLFLYYKNKQDLFTAAFADLVERLGAGLEEVSLSGRRGRDLLAAAVDVVLSYFDENHDFMAQVGLGRLPGCGERSASCLKDLFQANYKRMREILSHCAASGVVKDEKLDVAASFLFGLCRSSMLYYTYLGRARKPVAARREEVIEMFLKGAGQA